MNIPRANILITFAASRWFRRPAMWSQHLT